MNIKEQSHKKYESLNKEDKEKLITYARSKLPSILKNSKWAIQFQIYKYIRSKL